MTKDTSHASLDIEVIQE